MDPHDLHVVAPAFVELAGRIGWCVAATVTAGGLPSTNVVQPVWEWDGDVIQGWVELSGDSAEAANLAVMPAMSLTYFSADHGACSADCATQWESPDPQGPRRVRLVPRILQVASRKGSESGVGVTLSWRRSQTDAGDPACWAHLRTGWPWSAEGC